MGRLFSIFSKHMIALAFVGAMPSHAATFSPTLVVKIGSAELVLNPILGLDGRFREAYSLIACDGSVRVAIACDGSVMPSAAVQIGLEGSIFPYLSMFISFTDFDDPTTIDLNVSSGIPTISGLGDTVIEGSLTVSASRNANPVVSPLPSGTFVEGYVTSTGNLVRVADVGAGSVVPNALGPTSVIWAPIAGSYDCAIINGCSGILMQVGIAGKGNGEQYTLSGRFDLDAAPMAPVPLPATGALLLGALALLKFRASRRT